MPPRHAALHCGTRYALVRTIARNAPYAHTHAWEERGPRGIYEEVLISTEAGLVLTEASLVPSVSGRRGAGRLVGLGQDTDRSIGSRRARHPAGECIECSKLRCAGLAPPQTPSRPIACTSIRHHAPIGHACAFTSLQCPSFLYLPCVHLHQTPRPCVMHLYPTVMPHPAMHPSAMQPSVRIVRVSA